MRHFLVLAQSHLYSFKKTPLISFSRTLSLQKNSQIIQIKDHNCVRKKLNDHNHTENCQLFIHRRFSNNSLSDKSHYFKNKYESKFKESRLGELSERPSNPNDGVRSLPLKDLRDPNERIDELLPEDVEKKIDGRLKIPLSREGRLDKGVYYYEKKMIRLGREGKVSINIKKIEFQY